MAHSSLQPPQVLIVGAGPTGLAAAMSLARAGIALRVIDRAPCPATTSRAIGIQARTLELLELHRVVEPFIEIGHRGRAAHLYSNGQTLLRLDFDPLQTRYPYLLFVDQSQTESILAEHLRKFGVDIERGVELIGLQQDAAGVDATLRLPDGRVQTQRVRYLVGADGAHSTVRHLLGGAFAGETLAQSFLLADLRVDWALPVDEFQLFASAEGLAGIFPLGGDRYRLIADRPPVGAAHQAAVRIGLLHATSSPTVGAGAQPEGRLVGGRLTQIGDVEDRERETDDDNAGPSLDECQQWVERRIHVPVRLSQLAWSSYYHIHSRMVERLRTGNVFLAGDAVHVHSPAGAQGMNTGIHEALNLGWKLAQVLNGGAPDHLLDTYHLERNPIERGVLRQTRFVTHLVEADHGVLRLVRDQLIPLIASLGPVRDAARRAVSELAIQYRRSPLTLECPLDGGVRAGERAPDALVHVMDGPLGQVPYVARLFDLYDPVNFTLLVMTSANDDEPRAGEEAGALGSFAAKIEALLRARVRTWRVSDTQQPCDASGESASSLAFSYGRTRPCFYLVRPDGYVAARGRLLSDAPALLRYGEDWFGALPQAQRARETTVASTR
ncbi:MULTISPECIES: FAD-dependent monooxygenase [Burkholderiaceae]|uniref:FAD-dependent monooxygenase n=1 Tax=Burkholderiaceae TaxID=119060 RepID=UPI0009652DD2|nr:MULTISPECIES: FAD-dependent monooxygenase [Burkholderiaceae]MCG1038563.1 FAD-dependent monooxygenase [Mycetohabitans sp. B7]SIT80738.1 2-polyprenyl-6-methoxyphenol hydroxylase [Burkholderia sp. b14]